MKLTFNKAKRSLLLAIFCLTFNNTCLYGATTLSVTTFSITALSIMILSKMIYKLDIQHIDTQHNG